MQQQQREQSALPLSAELELACVTDDLERTKNPKFHFCASSRRTYLGGLRVRNRNDTALQGLSRLLCSRPRGTVGTKGRLR